MACRSEMYTLTCRSKCTFQFKYFVKLKASCSAMKFLQRVWCLTPAHLCVTISRFCQSLYCDNQQVTHLMKLLSTLTVAWRKQDTNGWLWEFMQACIINSHMWECRNKQKRSRWAGWLPTGASHCPKNQLFQLHIRVLPKMNRSQTQKTDR